MTSEMYAGSDCMFCLQNTASAEGRLAGSAHLANVHDIKLDTQKDNVQ